MSSDRIASFRTHTVQGSHSTYLSPTPQSNLDGDCTKLDFPNFSIEEIFLKITDQIEETGLLLNKL